MADDGRLTDEEIDQVVTECLTQCLDPLMVPKDRGPTNLTRMFVDAAARKMAWWARQKIQREGYQAFLIATVGMQPWPDAPKEENYASHNP